VLSNNSPAEQERKKHQNERVGTFFTLLLPSSPNSMLGQG